MVHRLKSAVGKSISFFRFTYLSKNILQIGEAKVSKFKFMHTLSESKSIFVTEQKAIVSCFLEYVAFLLGHPVVKLYFEIVIESYIHVIGMLIF